MVNEPRQDIVFGLHLDKEIATATQLLAVGLSQITDSRWYAAEPATAFTCMAAGVERILKLTYGLDALHRGEAFPSDASLRRLGHDVETLDDLVRSALMQGARRTGASYVARLLADVEADPYWPGVLAALNSWAATSGRYRDLTILTGKNPRETPPHEAWEATELQCLEDLNLLTDASGHRNRAVIAKMRRRLAFSVLKWWHAIFRAWTHGVLGPDHRAAGTVLSPAGNRNLPAHLVDLLKPL